MIPDVKRDVWWCGFALEDASLWCFELFAVATQVGPQKYQKFL